MITLKVIAHYKKKMDNNEEQEVFDFFTDNLAKASLEFQNKVKESKIYSKIQEELNKYIRIRVPEYNTDNWYKQNGWIYFFTENGSEYRKGRYSMIGPITINVEGHRTKGPIFTIIENFDNHPKQIVFVGTLKNEEDFLTIERLIGI